MARPSATSKRRSVPKRIRTAYHEAGHAVLSASINDSPILVSIRLTEESLGSDHYRKARVPEVWAQVHLAGLADEELLCGRRSRDSAVRLELRLLAAELHTPNDLADDLEGSDQYLAVQAVLAMGCERESSAIAAEIERYYVTARESLRAVWPAVESVAKALLKHEELDSSAFFAAMGGHSIWGPVFEIQEAHGNFWRDCSA